LIVAIVNSAILHRHVQSNRALKFIFDEIFGFFYFFSSLKSSCDVNLACLLKTSGEKQTYFAYDLFATIVHMVAADEFLMAHNTEVKIAGFRGRELDLA